MEAPKNVAYGSLVTLRNGDYGSGILHSHSAKYPTGSEQQQVTTYTHKDSNNFWKITFRHGATEKEMERRLLQDGDIVRLNHNVTGKNLHSHNIPAPITVEDNEVSGYGNMTIGDENDSWMIVFSKRDEQPLLNTMITKFRLVHQRTGCYLAARTTKLPAWGFGQIEVVCTKYIDNRQTLWNIEQHVNEMLPKATLDFYKDKSSFWTNFLDLNYGMQHGNDGLVAPTSKRDALTSRPYEWLFMNRGIRMLNWKAETPKFYMLGNPVVWIGGTLSIAVFLLTMFVDNVQMKLGRMIDNTEFTKYGLLMLSGWFLHYIPFVIMNRVLYSHHYFPSLFFSTLLTGVVMDRYINTRVGMVVTTLFVSASVGTFVYFSPLTYGLVGDSKLLSGRVWQSSWNIV